MNPNALYSKTHFNNSTCKSHFSVAHEKAIATEPESDNVR